MLVLLRDYTSLHMILKIFAQVDSFRIGAKKRLYSVNTLSGQAVQETYETPILMQVPSGIGTSSQKQYNVIRNSGVNAIVSNGNLY